MRIGLLKANYLDYTVAVMTNLILLYIVKSEVQYFYSYMSPHLAPNKLLSEL